MNKPEWDDALENDLTPVADEHLEIRTLKNRGQDGLDFHTVSVWGVRAALAAAFELGYQAGLDHDGQEGVEVEVQT